MDKLEYYKTRGVCNDLFKCCLSDRKQFFAIKGYSSDLMLFDSGVTQGFDQGLLLFLIYINDLHKAIQCCKAYYFADHTDLFHASKSIKNLNKLVNRDMIHLNDSLSANIISLNVDKN